MSPIITDNLHKFGLEFQTKVISSLLSDKVFLDRVSDIVEVEFFEIEAQRWIVQQILDYHREYKNAPTTTAFKTRMVSIPTDAFRDAVIIQLREIKKSISDTDLRFVNEQFLEFCKNQKLRHAILTSADCVATGDYDQIKRLVDAAMKAGMERNLGHDYHKEIALRMSEMCRDTIATGWGPIDSLMDGGLGPGELGVMVAPAGIGKSWLLCCLGARAMKSGKNVAHFTLELNENYVGLRYDCCFTGIPFQQIRHEQHMVEEKIKHIQGKLFIKQFPIKSVSAQSLKFHVERIQALHGFKVDLLIVDYADILRQLEKEKNSNSYSEAGGIYEELRTVAGELNIPVWTASQTNRGGGQEDVVQAHDIADSYRKVMTADFVLSVSRNIQDKGNNTARFHAIKNRFGPDGITLYSHMDTSNGDIRIYEPKSSEAAEVQNKMEDGANSVKDMLKKKWQQSRNRENGENTDR